MATPEEIQDQQAQLLLNSVQNGVFVGNPKATDAVNAMAETVRELLDDVRMIINANDLKSLTVSRDVLQELLDSLKTTMKQRCAAQGVAITGNVARIGGSCASNTPVGQAFYWGGFVLSAISDAIVYERRNKIMSIAEEMNGVLRRDGERFRDLARAIRRLDKFIQNKTGWSIYEEEFQEFLDSAGESPEKVEVPEYVSERGRNTIIEIARNRAVINLLKMVCKGIREEPIMATQMLIKVFWAMSMVTDSVVATVGLQVGELATRSLEMYLEYKKDNVTLKDFQTKLAEFTMKYENVEKLFANSDY